MAKAPPKAARARAPRVAIEEKKMRGTYRKDRDGDKEIPISGAVASVVEPELTGGALAQWRSIVPVLCGLGVIWPQDIPTLYQAFRLLEEIEHLAGAQNIIGGISCAEMKENEKLEAVAIYKGVLSEKLKCITLYNSLMGAFLVSPKERLKAAALFNEEKKKKQSAADKLLGEK